MNRTSHTNMMHSLKRFQRGEGSEALPPVAGSASFGECTDDRQKAEIARAQAFMAGSQAARDGKKLDANPYLEVDDLHFVWLGAWAEVGMERIRKQNDKDLARRALDSK